MIRFIPQGNIFAIENVSSYAHGCNCAGAMGKGIAVQFKDKFPAMYAEYKAICKNGQYRPGDVFDYNYGRGHVYNLATQVSWRTKAEIGFIRSAVERMFELAGTGGVTAIAMPAIGAGLGGLKWNDVKTALTEIAAAYPDIDLYVVEKFAPAANNYGNFSEI